MQVEKTHIPGLLVIHPRIFSDSRGYFFESFNSIQFHEKTGLDIDWKQDNESMSSKGALRGLHYQLPPFAQHKLVRVAKGAVYDVAVDLRKDSPTFGKWFGLELSSKNKKQLFVPAGFAHGFQVLEDETLFVYKCSEVYNAEFDKALFYNDEQLGIQWPIEKPIVSEKDKRAPLWNEIDNPF